MEVPTLLGVTGFALWWIPAQILTIYEAVVLVSHPLMILAEGFSALTLTFSSGQLWGPCLASQSWSVQILILFGCAAVSGWSFFSMAKMYTAGTVASFISATNTAVALTLLLVLGVATFFVPHASITDATLLILYVTYNIWTACSLESVGVNGGLKISNLASFSLLNLSSASGIGLRSFDFATIIFEAFSIQIVTTLLVQMAIFVAVLRMCRHACTSDYNDHFLNLSKVGSKSSLEPINYGGSHQKQVSQQLAPSTKLVSWIVTIFWPSFGKSLLVLLYTHPLVTCAEETSRWPTLFHLTRAVLWRWVNVYLSLVIYAWSLFVDPEST